MNLATANPFRRRASCPLPSGPVAVVLLLTMLAGCGDFRRKGPQPTEILPGPAVATGTEELWIVARDTPDAALPAALKPQLPYVRSVVAGHELVVAPQNTAIKAAVAGHVATVRLQQSFRNPFTASIDAELFFSLRDNAAVSEMALTIGTRRIRAIVRERGDAQQMYNEAKRLGYVVSLLSADGPNVFRQAFANLEEDAAVDVEITYFQVLDYRGGAYELVLPLGQREPLLPKAPGSVNLVVDVDAGMRIESITSPSHEVHLERPSPQQAHVELDAVPPGRDFVLRYATAGGDLKMGLLADGDRGAGFFLLMLQPPADASAVPRRALEHIFVADCSASMKRDDRAQSRATLAHLLGRLDAGDTFQIIGLAAAAPAGHLAPASAANLTRATADLAALCDAGAAPLSDALGSALQQEPDTERPRLLTVLSNGHGGNAGELFAAVRRNVGKARIVSLGTGAEPNRHIVEALARLGGGAVAYLGAADAQTQVDDLFERLHHPLLTDVKIDWGNVEVADVIPPQVPDLYPGQPVVLSGRLLGSGTAPPTLRLSGNAGGQRRSYDLGGIQLSGVHPELHPLWARAQIAWLELHGEGDDVFERIRNLALQGRIVSPYTGLIAIDGP